MAYAIESDQIKGRTHMLQTANFDQQQDDFWRDALINGTRNPKEHLKRYENWVQSLQSQVAHLPQSEIDQIFGRFVARNAEYIALGQLDREALKAKLGLPHSTPNRLAQVAVETAVKATIWNSIGAFFRLFR